MRLIDGDGESYGYRKLTQLLRRSYGLIINKKKVYRLCKELGILLPQREKKQTYPRRVARNRNVTGSNQLWQMDIKYGYVAGKQRHFYVASLIDVFDRSIVAHYVGKACDASDVVKAAQKALFKRDIYAQDEPITIRTDNGPQFVSNKFHKFCSIPEVEHERIPNKSPNMNAYIESFHSILERECFQKHIFNTFEEAFKTVNDFIRFYNERRLHGSLGDIPPMEFMEKVKKNEVTPEVIAV